jgi:hypothetical protein
VLHATIILENRGKYRIQARKKIDIEIKEFKNYLK